MSPLTCPGQVRSNAYSVGAVVLAGPQRKAGKSLAEAQASFMYVGAVTVRPLV